LQKALKAQQTAGLLNALLSIEAEPKFTDRECEIGERLFDALCRLCPDAVALAEKG
jgi:hypothetical protein